MYVKLLQSVRNQATPYQLVIRQASRSHEKNCKEDEKKYCISKEQREMSKELSTYFFKDSVYGSKEAGRVGILLKGGRKICQ